MRRHQLRLSLSARLATPCVQIQDDRPLLPHGSPRDVGSLIHEELASPGAGEDVLKRGLVALTHQDEVDESLSWVNIRKNLVYDAASNSSLETTARHCASDTLDRPKEKNGDRS